MIALLCFSETGSLAYEGYDAYLKDYITITLGCMGIFGLQFIMNLIYLIFYCKRIRNSDLGYNKWKKKHFLIIPFVLFLSLTFSCKIVRLLYTRLFRLRSFSCQMDDDSRFIRYTKVFSALSLITFTLPLISMNILIFMKISWGTQLYINIVDSAAVTTFSMILLLLEHLCPLAICKNSCYPGAEIRKKLRRSSS